VSINIFRFSLSSIFLLSLGNYIPEKTTFVGYRSIILTVILQLHFMVRTVLFSVVNLLCFYVSTF
jgi:hypothetical protein